MNEFFLRYKIWLPRHRLDVHLGLVGEGSFEYIFGMENTDNIVNTFLIYRNARIAFFYHDVYYFIGIGIYAECYQLAARHHDLLGDAVIKLEYIFEQFVFCRLDIATVLTFFKKQADFVFGMGVLLMYQRNTNSFEHKVRKTIEYPNKGTKYKVKTA